MLRVGVGAIALIATFVAAVVHVASFQGVDIDARAPQVWYLHYGAMAAVLAALVLGVPWRTSRYKIRKLLALVPRWARLLVVVGLVYAIANMVGVFPRPGSGDPLQKGGGYFFNDHSTLREVSEAQFHAERSANLRIYSSVWLYLYLVSTLYLLTAKRQP